MKKILITSIGTGVSKETNKDGEYNYRMANYQFDGDSKVWNTPFIVDALKDSLTPDHIVLIGTIRSNWSGLYHYFCRKTGKEPVRESSLEQFITDEYGLKTTVEELEDLKGGIEAALKEALSKDISVILIRYGVTKEEIMQNYKLLTGIREVLNKNDENELILDITHSFRSLPIYQLLFFNYFTRLAAYHVKLTHIYYGMLEAQRELKGITPIVDLSALTDMFDLINGVNEVKSYGSVNSVVKVLGEDSEIGKWLRLFEWSTNFNNFELLKESIRNIIGWEKEKITAFSTEEMEIIEMLAEGFRKYFTGIKDMSFHKVQFQLGRWYFDQGRYGVALTAVTEAVRSYLTELREKVDNNLDVRDENVRRDSLMKLKLYQDEYPPFLTFYHCVDRLSKLRNIFAHNLSVDSARNQTKEERYAMVQQQIDGIRKDMDMIEKFLDNKAFAKNYQRILTRKPAIAGSDVNGIRTVLMIAKEDSSVLPKQIVRKYPGASVYMIPENVYDKLSSFEYWQINEEIRYIKAMEQFIGSWMTDSDKDSLLVLCKCGSSYAVTLCMMYLAAQGYQVKSVRAVTQGDNKYWEETKVNQDALPVTAELLDEFKRKNVIWQKEMPEMKVIKIY